MKMKKLFALGVIAPTFAMCTSCAGINKISYDQALNFAVEHYDQYEYLGFSPTYILKVNEVAIKDTKAYAKVVKGDLETFEQSYYVDMTIKDLATTIDTDEIKLLHVNSTVVNEIQNYVAMINGLIGYFEASFTLENNKYLGVYAKSNKLEQVICLAGFALPLIGDMIPSEQIKAILEIVAMLHGLSSSYANITLTASCNNIGLLDQAYISVDIKDLACSLDPEMSKNIGIAMDVVASKEIALDLELIVDYSNK